MSEQKMRERSELLELVAREMRGSGYTPEECDFVAALASQAAQGEATSKVSPFNPLHEIALNLQGWLDFHLFAGGNDRPDAAVIPPEWPRRSQLKLWIEILRAVPGPAVPDDATCERVLNSKIWPDVGGDQISKYVRGDTLAIGLDKADVIRAIAAALAVAPEVPRG